MSNTSSFRLRILTSVMVYFFFGLASLALAENDFEVSSDYSPRVSQVGQPESCPSLDELICICISEMITKNTYPEGGDADSRFKEDAEIITDIVACRKKEWDRIGQVACSKDLCDKARGGEPPNDWPGNSRRNFQSCKDAALRTLEKCFESRESSNGDDRGLDCSRKHWYHQSDPGHQPPDNDDNPYNNDPSWCPKEMLESPDTRKSTYPNYGEPDPVYLIIPRHVKGRDKPGPYDTGKNGKKGRCQDYKFPE